MLLHLSTHEATCDGRQLRYCLADTGIYLDYGPPHARKLLHLRQVTRRSDDGHQTAIVTSRRDLSAAEIAHRILGMTRHGDRISIAPRIPGSWPGFFLQWRHGRSTFQIQVENPGRATGGSVDGFLDGERVDPAAIPLVDDGRVHQLRIVLREGHRIGAFQPPFDRIERRDSSGREPGMTSKAALHRPLPRYCGNPRSRTAWRAAQSGDAPRTGSAPSASAPIPRVPLIERRQRPE